ncbi:N-ethylmaleimide reductase [Stackebrandtia endophytica]|uniref:N-ethylmaleimide reductase n=1 Tax=Stackebrandtia endophytica TaxID=1496996 RepID=A0A543AXI9_9ACTN|nr:alkene reductase [Stackebrandtia endophytica]TQL77286.1 N-ethylmaleimide reductase [Stackebrandtia endophytica]
MSESALLSPYRGTTLDLPNRIVMAPMTRYRATESGVPLPIVADYYAQRADAGLIVTEGISPSQRGQSDWKIPTLESSEHVAGWRAVTEAVHAAGGRIYAQLMHGGRKGHPLARVRGDIPAGPSAVMVDELVHTPAGKVDPVTPRAMTGDDIAQAIQDHIDAANNAMAAGFDGVELHGANSYLIHQFLADNTNLRTDRYGRGTIVDNIRFAVEVTTAVTAAIGAHRTAVRLSPGNPQFSMAEADPAPVYRALVTELNRLGLSYLHLTDNDDYPSLADLAPRWDGTLIANVGENRDATTVAAAEAALALPGIDLVSVGRAYIANPDFVDRVAVGAPMNTIDAAHLYTPTAVGYTDYPRLATVTA